MKRLAWLVLVMSAAAFLLAAALVPRHQASLGSRPSAGVAAHATVPAPEHVTTQFLDQPPKQRPAIREDIDDFEPPPVVQAKDVAGPAGIPETEVPRTTPQSFAAQSAQPKSLAAQNMQAAQPPSTPGGSPTESLDTEVNSVLAPKSAGLSTLTYAEPSVAQSGGYIFYTGNLFAARSTVGGEGSGAWSYIDPYNGMSDFCCDQDVITDPGRDMMMWYRQGFYQSSTGQGRFILGVSNDHGNTFCNYTYTPTNVNSSFTNSHWDLPQLALSNNFLYISVNLMNGSGGFLRKLIMRWPLDSLQSCSSFDFDYLNGVTSYWAAPVQGATTTMYIGDTGGKTDSITVYVWPEDSASYTTSVTQSIPTWTFENKNGTCTTPDNLNPCSISISTIQAAWLRKGAYQTAGEIGFMWDADQGGGFPYPYVEAVTLSENTLTVTGRPLVWSSTTAYQYPFASANGRGDLGVTLTMMGGSNYPSTMFLIDDDYDSTPPPWESWLLEAGNAGATYWGDFIRNRPFFPSERGWVSAGHTQQGGSANSDVQPQYYVLCRPRDVPSITRYLQTP